VKPSIFDVMAFSPELKLTTFPASKGVARTNSVRPSSPFTMSEALCAPTRAVRKRSARERNFMAAAEEEKCEDAEEWADGEVRKQDSVGVGLIDARQMSYGVSSE
jgi:hypothetical protein